MSDELVNRMDAIQKAFDELSFSDKIKFSNSFYATIKPYYRYIQIDGYVEEKANFAVNCNGGEYYVYLWKHMEGDIFYVGSGKNNRYRSKHRNDEFLKHIDKGDGVIYIVLDGVDKNTALFYERYISGSLGLAGYDLTNGDNNISRMGEDKFNLWVMNNKSTIKNDLTRRVEEVVLGKILTDTNFNIRHIRAIERFKEECGDHYFSSHGFDESCEKIG